LRSCYSAKRTPTIEQLFALFRVSLLVRSYLRLVAHERECRHSACKPEANGHGDGRERAPARFAQFRRIIRDLDHMFMASQVFIPCHAFGQARAAPRATPLR
jgi:hypothetical protein